MRKLVFFLLLISNISIAQVNLNLGLKAYYPFNGNANDASGNNNNPVFNNATLTSDRLGNPNSAYHFNGTSSYMRIPNSASVNFTTKMSIAAWVKVTGFYQGTCHGNRVIMKGDGDYLPGNYTLTFDDNAYTNGQNCFITAPDEQHQNFYGANTIQPPGGYTPYIQKDQWYSVIITSDGVTTNLYINCQLKGSGPLGSMTFTNSYDLFFGKLNSVNYPYWFNGDLDEVRLYDRALTMDEINVLGGCSVATSCTNWLSTPSLPSYVNIGDLDIIGNKLTIEANINLTQPYVAGTGNGNEGDIVSKHSGPNDVNYLLRPNHGYITTNNGFFATPDICEIQLNKTYHVAMVYDGATLKYYRNGFLMSQVPATGNLFQTNLPTRLGLYSGVTQENFKGYMNEVRIWNVARTQDQIKAYMNSSLPNPTTQTGLMAYYTFDNLLNKQGNSAWNGTLGGSATINATNPSCNFIADSCNIILSDTIINSYAAAQNFNPCNNSFTVDDATLFNTGDTVLVIQMKGAVIDVTNTATFGKIIDYKNAGNYEFNYVKSKTGNVIELKNKLVRQYDVSDGKVQLVRVPYFKSYNATKTVTCLPWDGNKGGIVVLNAQDSVVLNADIDVNGKGFKGGQSVNTHQNTTSCNSNNYIYPSTSLVAAPKGESIATVSNTISSGKGSPASGGGGGLDHNSGGGGGGNGGHGGFGGYQWDGCSGTPPFDNRGIGGANLSFSAASNKIFLGGGGGAGHSNEPLGIDKSGGDGGGIIIIQTPKLVSNGNKIIANGENAVECTSSDIFICHDGGGGGGAGGTVLLNIGTYRDNAQIFTNGGKGADLYPFSSTGRVGPGGGGGGGVTLVSQASLPANLTPTNVKGSNGVIRLDSNNPYGAASGLDGINAFGFSIPIATVAFKPNIDSVRFTENATSCTTYDFHGLAYINTNPVSTWQWYFGDGGTANTQDASHIYAAPGIYSVKLVVTDINGCKDSIIKNLNVTPILIPALSISTSSNNICKGNTATFTATAINGGATPTYQWQKNGINVGINSATYTDAGLNNGDIIKCTLTSSITCAVPTTAESNNITMTVSIAPANIRYPTLSSLVYQPLQLQARIFSGAGYEWKPNIGLSNNLINNPIFSYGQQQEFKIYITTASGCIIVDTLLIKINGKKGIYVPKAFSPNGNGTNDRLYPILVGIKELYYFRIYNRWGNLLFQTNSGNPALGWDGTFRGALQPVETYTWTVEGIDVDGIIIKKSGNTLLIR